MTECVLWIGRKTPRGYGKVRCGREDSYAHRLAYIEAHGAIPDGCVIDHLCGVPGCVNPAHLQAVPQAENVRRGRAARLTADAVREIRRADSAEVPALAARYGVSVGHARNLRAPSSPRWEGVR